MFKDQYKIQFKKEFTDGKLDADYATLYRFSPNGKEELEKITIKTVDLADVAKLLTTPKQ